MIYFVHDRSTDLIKIGYSKDINGIQKRIKTFATGNAGKIELLHVQDGTKNIESRIHRNYANLRVRGEWFRFQGNLKIYLDQTT